MKKALRKWLGVTEIYIRLYALETEKRHKCEVSDIEYPTGVYVSTRGIWAHMSALLDYLNVYPTEVLEDDPKYPPVEQPKRKRLVIKKRKSK